MNPDDLETLGQIDALIYQISGFREAASAAGVRDARLAYLAARHEGLVADNDPVNITELRGKYPALFNAWAPGEQEREEHDMNAFIRSRGGPEATRVKDLIAYIRRRGRRGEVI